MSSVSLCPSEEAEKSTRGKILEYGLLLRPAQVSQGYLADEVSCRFSNVIWEVVLKIANSGVDLLHFSFIFRAAAAAVAAASAAESTSEALELADGPEGNNTCYFCHRPLRRRMFRWPGPDHSPRRYQRRLGTASRLHRCRIRLQQPHRHALQRHGVKTFYCPRGHSRD